MKNAIKVLICTTAAFGLTGCQSFLADLGLAKRGASDASIAQEEGTSRLALGRSALKAGAPGTAIHHFERAIFDPADAPEAYNGMGVAYARLGREDLAERFFNAALMLRPNDTRIARNLERLYESGIGQSRRAKAARDSATNRLVAQAEADAFAQGYLDDNANAVDDRGPVSIDRRRGRTHRDSNREIIISDAQPVAPKAATKQAVSRAPAANDTAAGARKAPEPALPARISAAGPEAPAFFDYTKVACLDGSKPAIKDSRYPIRVSLQDAVNGAKAGE